MKLVEHTLLITRDITHVIHCKKYDHEIPILHMLHGADNVKIESSEEVEYQGFNVSDEYERLKAKYNRKDDGNMTLVQREYGNDAYRLAQRLNIPYTQGTGQNKKSVQIDHRKEKVRGNVGVQQRAKVGRPRKEASAVA